MQKIKKRIIPLILALILLLAGCSAPENEKLSTSVSQKTTSLADIPEFSGKPYIPLNNNIPYFNEGDLTEKSFEKYSDLDSLGRCQTAFANVGRETMPTEKRGNIGMVKPTGWQVAKYDFVDGKYLYNRCHLIGYQLTAENANEKNLITGTRYLNVKGMLPFENMVADYVKETGNHVLYRVTPIFKGNELVARGVIMEAESVEDKGDGVLFNVYVYNNQPGVKIDYMTGKSSLEGKNTENNNNAENRTYVVNTKSKKFHLESCTSVKDIKPENREIYKGSKKELENSGFSPCQKCNP